MNYNEPLLWEKGEGLTTGYSFPKESVPQTESNSRHLRDNFFLPSFSEPVVARHFTRLSTWNYGVDTDIYPLGSCTMKYNPKIHERIAQLKGFSDSHPLQDDNYSQGALEILYKTGEYLKEITGMDDVTLQPAAGAHGELVSMLMFKKYFKEREENRTTVLIPDSAHGTNPASATMCGFKVKVVPINSDGYLMPEVVEKYMDESVAGIMITNPGTLGLFEPYIKEICDIVHSKGGLVYGDGANLNPLLGQIKVGDCGIDAMHINLHKTFSTPHGGGGPGAGPVCVKKLLSDYLPSPGVKFNGTNYYMDYNNPKSIGRVHGFNGNFSVVLKACSFILSQGAEGLKKISEVAVLNANYVRVKLSEFYHIPYSADSMHEVLFTDKYQKKIGISTLDIAKGLIDRGIHPPTIYFPLVVSDAFLLEPTENESLKSLEHLIDIFIDIAKEAEYNSQKLKDAPTKSVINRVDETLAARHPVLKGEILGRD